MSPIFAIFRRSRPKSSTIEVSRLSQKVTVLRSGTGRIEELKLMPANVLLISALTASNGVSSLNHVKDNSEANDESSHKSVRECFNTDTEGKEALSFVKAS